MTGGKRKTKWVTVVADGDLITVGNIQIRVRKDRKIKHGTELEIEAKPSDKITKRGDNGQAQF